MGKATVGFDEPAAGRSRRIVAQFIFKDARDMPTYTPPIKDIQFLLHDLMKVSESDIPGYDELEPDFTGAVLEEAGKIEVHAGMVAEALHEES